MCGLYLSISAIESVITMAVKLARHSFYVRPCSQTFHVLFWWLFHFYEVDTITN